MTHAVRIAKVVGLALLLWLAVCLLYVNFHNYGPGLHYSLQVPGGKSSSIIYLGETDSGTFGGYAWRIEAVGINEKSAALQVRTKHFPDEMSPAAMYRALDSVTPLQLTYKPYTVAGISVDGAPPLVLNGFIASPCIP